MRTGTRVGASGRSALASVIVLVALGACSRSTGPQEEIAWARAALERNANLEVVASDPSAGVVTVRVKSTGELRTVRPAELIAALPPGLPSAGPTTNPTAAAPPTAPEPAAPAAPTPPATPAAAATPPEAAPGTPEPPAAPAAGAKPAPQVDGQHVLASGPGYAITAADASGAHGASQPQNQAGSPASGAEVELRHDPIICQGSRLYHIDNRNLSFDGNALTAEDGCELHITNSHIAANGIGVSARAANVHIENSTIEGEPSAIDASGGAQIYAHSSTFKGTIRQNDTAAFHDLGGNAGD